MNEKNQNKPSPAVLLLRGIVGGAIGASIGPEALSQLIKNTPPEMLAGISALFVGAAFAEGPEIIKKIGDVFSGDE